MFTPEQSLLRRSIPLRPPCQSPSPLPATRSCPPPDPARHPARHPTLPATTRSATPPCLAAFPDSLALLVSHDCVASVATPQCRPRPLCVWGASKRDTPSNILHTPSNILRTPSNILRSPSNILRTPSNILHNPLQYYT